MLKRDIENVISMIDGSKKILMVRHNLFLHRSIPSEFLHFFRIGYLFVSPWKLLFPMTQASYSVLDNETLRFPRQLNNYNVNSIVSAQNVCILRNRKIFM